MRSLLPFIVTGLATGAVYGLAGTGLVLTYKTSGIFNFAHGAVAAAAAYVFYWLNVDNEISWITSLLVSVLGLGMAAGLLLRMIARHLSVQRVAMQIVGTIGLIMVVQGLATVKFGSSPLRLPQYLPRGTDVVRLGGVNTTWGQITIILVSLVAVAALYLLFRFTHAGVAMRAVVDSPELVSLHGTSPGAVEGVAWVIGASFAALSGVLVAPLVGIESIALTFLVVQAFGAAAIGGFSSIPMTYVGGIVIGVLASISTKYVIELDWLTGLPPSLPFVVLFAVLIFLPKSRLATPARGDRPRPEPARAPARVQAAMGVVVVAMLALLPTLAPDKLNFFTVGATQAIILLSLGLLVRTAGLVSLSHATFAAIGAVAFAQFASNFSLPWLVALVLGALTVIPVAALLAIPTIRLSGLFLALATFGFGLLVERMLYRRSFMFTSLGDGRPMPRPSFASSDEAFYYVALAALVFTSLAMLAMHRGRLGRLLRGMAGSSVAAATLGLNTHVTRSIAFCLSGFFAGVGGILYGSAVHFSVFGEPRYSALYSLVLIAVLAVAPMREPWYALVAIVAVVIPAYWQNENAVSWLNAIFGIAAVLVAVRGGAGAGKGLLRRREGERRRRTAPEESVSPRPVRALPAGASGLEVQGLRITYGGIVAVDQVTLRAPIGQITGLIGPNGAGKTTTFDACSGLVRPHAGAILLDGRDITQLNIARRGQLGLGRTFQVMQLGDSLSVAENVALGAEAAVAGSSVRGQLVARRSERKRALADVAEALALCGISELADVPAGALSTGERRLVELARCVAGKFHVLLLDEPSSGLDAVETARFAATLRRLVEERGCGVLLVEHDMSLVLSVSQHVYVLDFGKLLFQGTPPELVESAIVRKAYLGSSDLTLDDGVAV